VDQNLSDQNVSTQDGPVIEEVPAGAAQGTDVVQTAHVSDGQQVTVGDDPDATVITAPSEKFQQQDQSGYDVGTQVTKDVSFTQTQAITPASGERFGELGAVMFDDPMWYPGLPDYPAGSSQSKLSRIYTGGVSESGYKYTDGKSDALMAIAVQRFNQIGTKVGAGQSPSDIYEPDVAQRSKELAARIMDVKLEIDDYTNGMAVLEVKFADGKVSNPIVTRFAGHIGGSRTVELHQENIKGDHDLGFNATLQCKDADGGCQNALITLVQTNGKKICRMAYIVFRSGNAHITMSESDRLHYEATANQNYQYLAQYFGNTAYNACLVNKNRKDIPVRLKQQLLAYCGDSTYKKIPAAKTIGLRTWAAAYGAAGFRVVFSDEDHWTGYKTGESVICGPLVSANNKNPIFSQKLGTYGPIGNYIKSIHLVNNDAAGNLNLLFRINGHEDAEMRISVTSMIRNTGSPAVKKVETQVSEDPRG